MAELGAEPVRVGLRVGELALEALGLLAGLVELGAQAVGDRARLVVLPAERLDLGLRGIALDLARALRRGRLPARVGGSASAMLRSIGGRVSRAGRGAPSPAPGPAAGSSTAMSGATCSRLGPA